MSAFAGFFAGIRYSLDMAEISYRRLRMSAEKYASVRDCDEAEVHNIAMFTDAWSLIDNARRFQRLAWKMPDNANEPTAGDFVTRWPHLKTMRDSFQHPDKDFSPLDSEVASPSVFGRLSWVDARREATDRRISVYVLAAGPPPNGQPPSTAGPPVKLDGKPEIRDFILEAAGVSVDLTNLMEDIVLTGRTLSEIYSRSFWENAKRFVAANPNAPHPFDRVSRAFYGDWIDFDVTNLYKQTENCKEKPESS